MRNKALIKLELAMIIINNILMRPIIALVASFLLESENIAAVFSDELDYGVYFDTRYSGLFPNGEQNPLGSGFYPNSPDKWSNVERVSFLNIFAFLKQTHSILFSHR